MLSLTSVSTCAANPSRKPIVHARLCFQPQMPEADERAEEERVADTHARPAAVPLVRLRRAVVVAVDR